MAAIASTDVTVSFVHKDYTRRARLNTVRLSFTMASLTYPANGVPLPAATKFGLPEGQIFHMAIMGNEAQGYTWKYDRTNHTLRCYVTAGFTPAGTVAAPTFTGSAATFGPFVDKISYQNVKGADADVADSMTVDQASGPTNDDFIDTFAAVADGAWAYSENTEIDIPRNVGITLYNDSGGGINMEEAAFTATVTGTFRGAAQTDTITETFTAGNKAITNTKYRWKYGVKPFDHITSVVITGLTANQNSLKIGVGLGRLLGVPVEPKDNVVADFVKVTKNSANLAPVAYDDTNKTLDLGALADNDDLDIEVEVASIGEAYTPAGTNSAPAFTGTAGAATVMSELATGGTGPVCTTTGQLTCMVYGK